MLFTLQKRTGLYFVCEGEGRRRVTLRQEWTDRGAPALSERLAVDGLTAARALVDAIDAGKTGDHGMTPTGVDETGLCDGLEQPAGCDGGGEHGRIAATRDGGR